MSNLKDEAEGEPSYFKDSVVIRVVNPHDNTDDRLYALTPWQWMKKEYLQENWRHEHKVLADMLDTGVVLGACPPETGGRLGFACYVLNLATFAMEAPRYKRLCEQEAPVAGHSVGSQEGLDAHDKEKPYFKDSLVIRIVNPDDHTDDRLYALTPWQWMNKEYLQKDWRDEHKLLADMLDTGVVLAACPPETGGKLGFACFVLNLASFAMEAPQDKMLYAR